MCVYSVVILYALKIDDKIYGLHGDVGWESILVAHQKKYALIPDGSHLLKLGEADYPMPHERHEDLFRLADQSIQMVQALQQKTVITDILINEESGGADTMKKRM